MTKERRNQLIAIGFFVVGIIFLYIESISLLPAIITQNVVLLKGIALVLLSIAANSRWDCLREQTTHRHDIRCWFGHWIRISLFVYSIGATRFGISYTIRLCDCIRYDDNCEADRNYGCSTLGVCRVRLPLPTLFSITGWYGFTFTSTRYNHFFDCLLAENLV